MLPFDHIVPRILGCSRHDLARLVRQELEINPLLIEGSLCLRRHLQRLLLTERKAGFGAQLLSRLDERGFFRPADGRTIEDLARDVALGPEGTLDAMWLLQEFAEELQALEPLPPSNGDDRKRVTPDVYVLEECGQLVVRYDRRGLLLRIDDMKARTAWWAVEAEAPCDWLRRARWVIRSLDKRRTLLTRLVSWLLVHERKAFERGKHFVKGMAWRDAADNLGVNLEAMFLIVENKVLGTPHDALPAGFFFKREASR